MIRISVVCLALTLFSHFGNWKVRSEMAMKRNVCQTEDCKTISRMYLAHMDNTESPCTNFYDYVCRNWKIQNPRPDYADTWFVEHVMAEKALQKLKHILEDDKIPTPMVRHVKALYSACMELPYLPKAYPETIKTIMAEAGNWPMFLPKNKEIGADISWSTIDNRYIQETAESALFDVTLSVAVDGENNLILTEFNKLKSPYGTLVRFGGWGGILSRQKSHYKNILYKIIENVAPGNVKDFKNIDTDLNEVIEFREKLREIIDKLPSVMPFKVMTIKDLQDWYNNLAGTKNNAQIDWLKKIHALYKKVDANRQPITYNTFVNVQKLYISKLVEVLKKTPKKVIVNHIHLYFAERNLVLPPDALRDLNEHFKHDVNPTGKIRHALPRWQWCIKKHNLEVTLRKMYITSVASAQPKAEAENLIEETKRLLSEQILESTWLDTDTKNRTINKIKRISSSVGNPVWINPPSTTDFNTVVASQNPMNPDVYFDILKNEIYVSTSYLQLPRFSLTLPYMIRYGTTVFTFGHELYHSLDTDALELNFGNGSWWPSKMLSKRSQIIQCFRDEYNKKRNQEISILSRVLTKLPETIDEDLADVMGAKLAYRGYKQLMQKSNGTCLLLPGFEDKTCDQLFFISMANTFCADSSPSAAKELLLTDVHSSPKTRVNGITSNMKEFDAAFGCTSNKPVTKKRCDLWIP